MVNWAPEIEAKLAELFVTSLYVEEVARENCEKDTPLVTLEQVETSGTEIFNHGRCMTHTWKGQCQAAPSLHETPMEISPIEKKKESALHYDIAQFEKELMAVKAQANAVQQTLQHWCSQRHKSLIQDLELQVQSLLVLSLDV